MICAWLFTGYDLFVAVQGAIICSWLFRGYDMCVWLFRGYEYDMYVAVQGL